MYDLIILGAGPAGITAAVYAARKKMDFMVITRDIGGQAAWSGEVDNYTGYQFVSGVDLVSKFEEHMRKYDFPLNEHERVESVVKEGDFIRVKTDKLEYDARTVIIATGKCAAELSVPGEIEYRNKGVSYCATCDGPLFVNKEVAIIGGGNSALDATLQLAKLARHTFVINKATHLTGDEVMREKVKTAPSVTVMNETQVREVLGERMVSGIRVHRDHKEEYLPVQGIFVEIGLQPNSAFAPGVKCNELGEIAVNCSNETNVPGIFAAGDVTTVPEKQIIIAAGEGAKAALSASRYLAQSRF
ncbi:MAG: NAD(P)/FAD-dependent oxidoreductase [Deltaproteobacteria bacterium]